MLSRSVSIKENSHVTANPANWPITNIQTLE